MFPNKIHPAFLVPKKGCAMTRIFLFPGQGSQCIGMGGDLFDRHPHATQEASDILGYSIKRLCLQDPDKLLNITTHTQPALYVVNALMLRERLASSTAPDWVAGHSLGEYNALLASGVFDFAAGLEMVRKRAELMGRQQGGGMAVVVGLSSQRVLDVLSEGGFGKIDVANFNTPAQTVISGPEEEIKRAGPEFMTAGARICLKLNVSGAFHSRYMEPVREEFRRFLAPFQFRPLGVPVVGNCAGTPYGHGEVAQGLVEQLTSSVQWVRTMELLMGLEEPVFEEIGPSKVLTGMLAHMAVAAK
jgi:trans-AT polyketide synthase, acyltransferase and oxidoreductase domains